jgi:hypothetical protein
LTRTITNVEFIEWIAFYTVEAEDQITANKEAQRKR